MSLVEAFDLSGKVAVVSGGGRGIGEAVAVGLGQAGATVVPAARTKAEIEDTAHRIKETGSDARAVTVDVTDEASINSLINTVREEYGEIGILVNNAGVNPDDALGKPETVHADGFDTPIAVNLRGAFLLAKAASSSLHDSDGGTVINIASIGGLIGLPRQHPYVASKHGLVGITKSMAIDWAPEIRVNCVAPAYVETDLIAEALETDRIRESLLDQTPLTRFAAPTEIAGPVVFLASDAASYITGAVLPVDGGWTAR
jgi:NAD(P)-dependent dehydrogenase (short-subunit alcohol dehydrogenase family)